MTEKTCVPTLEHKFCQFDASLDVTDTAEISGYASLFGRGDQGGDVVLKGAYTHSLQRLGAQGRSVKMLWQHDPAQPIGVWGDVREDSRGLHVKGRILTDVARGRDAMALVRAGAIDGLSIGYRTVKARKDAKGQRLLAELELWEVSLVTFPMLPEARVGAKSGNAGDAALAIALAEMFRDAGRTLAEERAGDHP
ncbi:HK97 family phage prohead protease [Maritimibacter sp. 55A14]|uniref:HK97 family phage prohead protease n=1 Tax=Maritimibacter sp. 55A14 TaxID=2174844 RepID=UPI000D6219F2|nr:HK97 family phage prohead protease [Maritimibacter sp. 55A14]PWE30645.1 HK97 family phage prohead protease [Maritimibacter sp. 55A14]